MKKFETPELEVYELLMEKITDDSSGSVGGGEDLGDF